MERWIWYICVLPLFISGALGATMDVWVTTGDENKKLQQEASIEGSPDESPEVSTVTVWMADKDQYIKGFGAAFSNAATYLIYNSPEREQIIQELFSTSAGIGIEYIRLVMGGSDLNAVEPYTYNDADFEDFEMTQFSIAKDLDFTIPLIKLVLQVNPNVKIMASPWSPPAWMKNNDDLHGGSLKEGSQYLEALAEYFVKFVQAYAEEGINIDAVTTQNEPEHAALGYPTMSMPPETQRDLIRDHLGPKFEAAGITTEIIIWDHNWDQPSYPLTVLADSAASQYVGGTGWHCYAGDKNTPQDVRNQHPDKDVYFTECSGGDWDTNFGSTLGWNIQNLFIGQTRVGARTVLLWNMALDENHGPRVGVTGGCADCRGVITVPNSGTYMQNVEYYTIGHFSKFVRQGAQRINTAMLPEQGLESVAFQNPDNSVVVVVLNTSWDQSRSFQVSLDYEYFRYNDLPPRSVATFIRN